MGNSLVFIIVIVESLHRISNEHDDRREISVTRDNMRLNVLLTGRLLHLHHQGLQGVESLQLLLFVLQIFLQQLGPLSDQLTIHPVGVFT